MKPAPFELYSPETLEEVLVLLAEYGEAARVLAGGQSLVPLLNMRMVQPRVLISINRCPALDHVRAENGAIAIGALTRQARAEEDPAIRVACPLLAKALPLVGGMANRNRGTVCGSLAHADPLAELPAVALALDAEFVLCRAGASRTVPARDFFVSELTTAIEPDELLAAVRFPKTEPGARASFVEIGNRRHGFAVAGVALRMMVGRDKRCESASIAAIGVAPTATRLEAAERSLEGAMLDDAALDEAAAAASGAVDPTGDLHADAGYRRYIIGVLVRRAVEAALADPVEEVRS